ncbi:hypothetical protein ABIB06_006552 [Bradyrhizobium sp. LB8.2]|uniref:hypothetical protein n=1 Tax=unclassified Bradyrhizobium TaxID=2631580 RepID=UPI0033989F03
MSINTRLAAQVAGMLTRHGFDVTLQQGSSETGGDFDPENPTWTDLTTVKAVWDNPRNQVKGLNDGGAASMVSRRMTIAYREDLKATEEAIGLRVVVNGVPSNVLAVSEIGSKVGLRLMLDAGTEQ